MNRILTCIHVIAEDHTITSSFISALHCRAAIGVPGAESRIDAITEYSIVTTSFI